MSAYDKKPNGLWAAVGDCGKTRGTMVLLDAGLCWKPEGRKTRFEPLMPWCTFKTLQIDKGGVIRILLEPEDEINFKIVRAVDAIADGSPQEIADMAIEAKEEIQEAYEKALGTYGGWKHHLGFKYDLEADLWSFTNRRSRMPTRPAVQTKKTNASKRHIPAAAGEAVNAWVNGIAEKTAKKPKAQQQRKINGRVDHGTDSDVQEEVAHEPGGTADHDAWEDVGDGSDDEGQEEYYMG